MPHDFQRNKCTKCSLQRVKVNCTKREYESGEKWEWRYYKLPSLELNRNAGHCPL